MHSPGYYTTNYRALRFSEVRRMHGLPRAFKAYLATRFMRPAPGLWMPALWADLECRREDLSAVMLSARIPASFPSRKEWIWFMGELEFPGYGMSTQGVAADDGSRLEADSVELPQRDKERWVAVREAGGSLKLVDDFVFDTSTNAITRVKLEQRKLRYYNREGQVVREKEL